MLVAAAAFALTGTAAHAAQIGDGTFNNSDWSLTVFTNSASNVMASQAVAAGPHGSFRSVTDFDGDAGGSVQNSLVLGANIYTAAEYNPAAQGALAALNMSIDSICPEPDGGCAGDGQAYGFAVLQGGKVYLAGLPWDTGAANINQGWVTNAENGLTAADFGLVDVTPSGLPDAFSNSIENPNINPDFSASGGVIQFGFITGNSALNSGYIIASGYDNFQTNVEAYSAQGGVTEPATWALMLLGVGGLGATLRARRGLALA
jgi:hypothetical protein